MGMGHWPPSLRPCLICFVISVTSTTLIGCLKSEEKLEEASEVNGTSAQIQTEFITLSSTTDSTTSTFLAATSTTKAATATSMRSLDNAAKDSEISAILMGRASSENLTESSTTAAAATSMRAFDDAANDIEVSARLAPENTSMLKAASPENPTESSTATPPATSSKSTRSSTAAPIVTAAPTPSTTAAAITSMATPTTATVSSSTARTTGAATSSTTPTPVVMTSAAMLTAAATATTGTTASSMATAATSTATTTTNTAWTTTTTSSTATTTTTTSSTPTTTTTTSITVTTTTTTSSTATTTTTTSSTPTTTTTTSITVTTTTTTSSTATTTTTTSSTPTTTTTTSITVTTTTTTSTTATTMTTTSSTITTTTTTTGCPNIPAPNFQPWASLDYANASGCGPSGDHACYGNGRCLCEICICNVGWRGPFCSQLDLLPAKKAAPGIPMKGSHPTWGGSAIYEGGKWKLLVGGKVTDHAFDPYTYWQRDPPYNQTAATLGEDPFGGNHPWEYTVNTSKDPFPSGGTGIDATRDLYEPKAWLSLYEADGEDAGGPYNETVRKWLRAFRADMKTDPASGALLLLTNAGGGFVIIQSASGSIHGPWTDKDGNPIDQAWAGSTPGIVPTTSTQMPMPVYKYLENGHCSEGWNSLGSLAGKYITYEDGNYRECTTAEKAAWNCHLADPAFVIHPNGTTVITYRGTECESATGHADHTERLGFVVADCWNCPYTKGLSPLLGDDEVMDGGVEDLFMWVDSSGTHMVVHTQAQDHAYDPSLDRAGFHHKKKRGAYLFSADGRHRWSISDWELFPSEIRWDDGTTQFLLKQQRPSIIFDLTTGHPKYFVSGVDFLFDACCDWYAYGSGWTLVQPISSCPAGQVLTNDNVTCTACTSDDLAYAGRCQTATSKYGECACARCSDGWSGDSCELPVYTTVCNPFAASHECEDMAAAADTIKWLGRTPVDDGTCLTECQDYAVSMGLQGCCFKSDPGDANRNCRFFAGQIPTATTGSWKFGASCYRQQVT
eukprot:TRINITY_DN3840_c0_g1_i1.p1 TRINITY_DN3840_c0_g1~~TRINITY_DN3840_c0_g1_i1.p1  ORF type:complete len:1033 (+),score=73.51 TRINITY_DN3840_c0_g1_i1:51-3101(+)